MEQTNKTITGYRWILPVFLSILVYGLLLSIVQYNTGYIPIKLVATDIYIPIYYWLALIIYTSIYSLSNKIKFSGLIPNMLVLGIFLHIYFMLLQLNQSLLFNPDYARIYLAYAFIIETGLFAASSYFLCRVFLRGNFLSNPQALPDAEIKKDIYLYLPFAINVFYHLYRDAGHVNPLYFCFHLLVLLSVYLLYRNKSFFQQFRRERVRSFLTQERTIIALIFLSALFIRAIFAFHIIHLTGNTFPTASDDGPTYHDNGILMIQSITNLIGTKKIFPSAYDPGYSIFLGFIYKIFGPNFYAAALVQSILNGLMTVAIYLIAKEIFNRKIGIIAAILTAINQPLIMLSVVLTTEALYIPLLVFSIYCLIKFSKNIDIKKRNYYLLLSGINMGFAIITRAMLLLFPGMVICWLFLRERGLKWVKSGATLLIGLAPALLLITVLTYTNTGEFKIFTNKQDPNWVAFTERNDSRYTDPRHVYSNAKLIEMGINPFKDFKGSISIILKNPLKFLKIESEILPIRLKLFLFYPNAGYFDPVYILSSTTPNQYASTMEFYALLILTIGMVYVLINKERIFKSSLILALILYYLIIHVGLTAGQCWRYRIPLHPFFMIFAACGLYLFHKTVICNSSTSGLKKC